MGKWSQNTNRRPSSRRVGLSSSLSRDSVAKSAGDVADAGLAATLFVAPLFLGGRHDVGRLVFAACVAVTATAWCIRQLVLRTSDWRRSPANLILLAGTVLIALQLAPLPAAWMAPLAPLHTALVEPWTPTAQSLGLSIQPCASLNPEATRLSLAMWVAYAVLFIVAAQRLREMDDVQRLQRGIGLSAGWIALVGLAQWLVPNGKFLWIYQHPSRTATESICGPFVNRNHFGHFLVLGGVCLAAWLLQQRELEQSKPPRRPGSDDGSSFRGLDRKQFLLRWLPSGLFVVVGLCALFTASRGVAIALCAAGVALLPALWRQRQFQRRSGAGLMVVVVIGVALAVIAVPDDAASRITTVVGGELDEIDSGSGRRKIWQANWEIIRHNGWLGSGAGTHVDVYRTFMPDPPTTEYTHAESGYLQILSENGLLGAALLGAALLLVATWCLAAQRVDCQDSAFWPAVASAAALIASLAHSAVDFVWYIPACMTLTVLHAACLMRTLQLTRVELHETAQAATWDRTVNPLAAAGATIALVALLGPAQAASHWDAYLRVSRAFRQASQRMLADRNPQDAATLREYRTGQQAALETMVVELAGALEKRPQFADAHRQLANRCVQLFELRQQQSDNPMPLGEIRNAAMASQFATRAELMSWLGVAFSENAKLLPRAEYHARVAAALSPLDGDAYLRLAELAFLRGASEPAIEASLDQALRVRPYDGDVLLAAGVEFAARGDLHRAWELWRRSFATPGKHRLQIARLLGSRVPPDVWIESFQPQWDTLPTFWEACHELITPEQTALLLRYAYTRAEAENPQRLRDHAIAVWRQLARMQCEAELYDAAAATLAVALQRDPNEAMVRYELGLVYVKLDRLREAEEQLHWCVTHRPEHAGMRHQLQAVRRGLVARATTSQETKYR